MENRIRFFNTLTRNVELFAPNEDGKVKMYTCGPTVYHYAHIGTPLVRHLSSHRSMFICA